MSKNSTDKFDGIRENGGDYDLSYAKRKKDSLNNMQKNVLPLLLAQNTTAMSTGNTGSLPFNPFAMTDGEDDSGSDDRKKLD